MDSTKRIIYSYYSILRKKNSLSHEEFGKRLGVSRHSVNDWIAGRCYPKIAIYEKMLSFLQEDDDL